MLRFNKLSLNIFTSLLLVLSLCNCQTNYRKESLSQSKSLFSQDLSNNLSKQIGDENLASKELVKYELSDDSSSFCEAIQEEDDCLNDEPSQL